MSKNNRQDIIFMLTKGEVLACAKELKIPKEQVTDEVIELIEDKLKAEFGRWPEIVKEVLTQVSQCPLGLTCFPSCCWWKEGRCIFPR
ncbi:hypothetical protein ES708_01244 [subsurface metagenome]